jgi:hypothetical protein
MRGVSEISIGRKISVWWLLLLLLRMSLPEAAVLEAHFHQHTEIEPAAKAVGSTVGKHLLTPKHQHCHTEQFYNVPFQPAELVSVEGPLQLRPYAIYRPQAPVCRSWHLLKGASLRGPPTLG